MSDWTILELAPTKDIVQIKKAYALQVKKYHPEEFPEEFKQLQKAYKAALQFAKIKEPEKTKIDIEKSSQPMDISKQVSQEDINSYIVEPPENYWMPIYSKSDMPKEEDNGKDEMIVFSKIHFLLKQGLNPVAMDENNQSLLVLEDYIKEFLSKPLIVNDLKAYQFLFQYKLFQPFFEMKEVWCLIADHLLAAKFVKKSICAYIIYEFNKYTFTGSYSEYFLASFPAIDVKAWKTVFLSEEVGENFIHEIALDFCKDDHEKLGNGEIQNRPFLFISDEQRQEFSQYILEKQKEAEYERMIKLTMEKAEGMAQRQKAQKGGFLKNYDPSIISTHAFVISVIIIALVLIVCFMVN